VLQFLKKLENFRLGRFFLSAMVFGWLGCFFESTQPLFITADANQNQENLILLDKVPAEGQPDSAVKLYLPSLYPGLGGESEAEDHYGSVKVLDHHSNQVVQYALTTQRFKHWSAKQEMQWNFFHLQTSFFFPDWLPDTNGVGTNTSELYRRIGLHDQFTRYVDSSGAEKELDRLLTTRTAAMGLRLELNATGDTIVVRQSVVGGPAYLAGIRNHMRIIQVGDSSVVGDSALFRFTQWTKGDSGTVVTLTLLSAGVARVFTVVKAPVQFPSVMVDSVGSMPVVSLFVFADSTVQGYSTATEFRDALKAIQSYPVFVLDLRQDPGGSLSQCLQVADEMLGADTVIIRQEQRFFDDKYRVPLFAALDQRASSRGVGTNRKVVLLADSGSASAAEILIAGLRDNLKSPLEKGLGKWWCRRQVAA
jgi:hypothetical protein